MWIKICGITTLEEALVCAEAGADAIGFVFAESRRRISPEEAGRIAAALPPGLEKVGVFVNTPRREVAAIQADLNLELLQFHGAESPEYCASFHPRVKVIKAFRVATPPDLEAATAYWGKSWAWLLDSRVPGAAGGTGESWDWWLLQRRPWPLLGKERVILAGGLNPQNAVAALQAVDPDGVDISSGVEKEGRKDASLIRQFIDNVRRWEQQHELTR